jgi:hypothetical protein
MTNLGVVPEPATSRVVSARLGVGCPVSALWVVVHRRLGAVDEVQRVRG